MTNNNLFTKLFTCQVLSRFEELSKHRELGFCTIYIGEDNLTLCLIIDCPTEAIADKLWRYRQKLLMNASLLGLPKRLILKMRGGYFGSASSHLNYQDTGMILPVIATNSCTYNDLLLLVAQSKYPTFVSEIPKGWHWGQPQYCILTSAEVTNFSGKLSPRWHGDDLTLLYDRSVFEKMMDTLKSGLEGAINNERVIIKDYEYRSYTVDSTRQQLCRDQEQEYRSNLEVMYLEDLDMTVRICHCIDRRPI